MIQGIKKGAALMESPTNLRLNPLNLWQYTVWEDTEPPIPIGGPKEYLVHMEWESPDTLTFGLVLTGVNPELRKVHDAGVLAHLARLPPYYRVFAPAMEDMVFFH
jgi:hypothetical protein